MCDDHQRSAAEAAWSAPRAAEGPAVDPVTLPGADEVTVTTMIDNTFDALLASSDGVTRTPMGAGRVAAPQFADGETVAGLRAEHGFSALVTVRSGNSSSTLLFDTGASPDALAVNAGRLGVDVGGLQGVVLSHGHAFEPVIGPTVSALTELAPELIVPGHCTGWRAQHTLAAALPDAWVQSSVGTSYTLRS